MSDSKDEARQAIISLLKERPEDSSICPSEAAQEMSDDWRDLMDDVREAASELEDKGAVKITQGGEEVDISEANGPVRIATDE